MAGVQIAPQPADEEITKRLDAIITLLKLAHGEQLNKELSKVREDKVDAAILDTAKRWTPAAKLQSAVSKKRNVSTRAVQVHIADLIALGLLEKRGGGPKSEYKASDLI